MTDKISITICGDGGCGNYIPDAIELAQREGINCGRNTCADMTSIGKSSITLRLVRSQWTHE